MSDTAISVNWFEIPVSELDRDGNFYEKVLGVSLIPMDMPNAKMKAIPGAEGNPVERWLKPRTINRARPVP